MRNHLLIICDDWEALDVYETKLRPFARELTCSPEAKHGLNLLRAGGIDGLVVDLTLPDVTPEEFSEELLASSAVAPQCSIVVREKAEALRPFHFVLKRPYDFSQLESALRDSGKREG